MQEKYIFDSIDWSESSFEEIKEKLLTTNSNKLIWLELAENKFQKMLIEKIFNNL